MENFCKGLVLGTVAGMVAGAVIIAKNKSLSNMVKQKAEFVEKKVADMTDKIKDKIDDANKNAENNNNSSSLSEHHNIDTQSCC